MADSLEEPTDSTERKEAAFIEEIKTVCKRGRISNTDIQRFKMLREKLGIIEERARELWDTAMHASEEPNKTRDTSQGLALYINTNQFYMEGFSGILDTKLTNLSNNTFDSVKVEISGDLLGRTECWECRLEPCKNTQKKFSVKPQVAGVSLVQVSASCRQGNCVHAYWAEIDLLIFEKTKELRKISIQADKLVEVGCASDNAKNMGNSVKVNIENLINQNKIRNANDLMMEYRQLTANYTMLSLEYDPELSAEFTGELPQQEQIKILHRENASATEVASLAIEQTGIPGNILLLAKPIVTIGRARTTNDSDTRVLPL